MSLFSDEIINEVEVRISAYKAERDRLLKSQDRIAELDALIAEAESHSEELKAKKSKK